MSSVQHIFQEYGDWYRKKYNPHLNQLRVMSAIASCRTSSLGAHKHTCDACGHEVISYNSCRNRHCPMCQTLKKEQWLNKQEQSLLLIHYFHIVFTLPKELRSIAFYNQKKVYGLFFRCVSETLQELAEDPEHLGARIGVTAILHTWGQNLMYHPHVHCIVPGGGLALNQKRFIQTRKKFFVHVNVLGHTFRRKFLSRLKKMYFSNELRFTGEIKGLQNSYNFKELIDKLYKIKWNVYAKSTFKNSTEVLKYLGNYTHRVAISNQRIIKVENGQVTFKWKDYKDNSKQKLMTLDAEEFIRRFLLHVLPFKFVKIRHFGLLSNRHRSRDIALCRRLITVLTGKVHPEIKLLSTHEIIFKITGSHMSLCPICKKGNMQYKQLLIVRQPRST